MYMIKCVWKKSIKDCYEKRDPFPPTLISDGFSEIRFWKKFVHRDGSYDAGGVQGRYVYSWPAVSMLMNVLKMMMRMIVIVRMKIHEN